MEIKQRHRVLLLVIASCLATTSALGQTAATIVGDVMDDSSARIPGATVTVVNTATGAERVV